MYLFKRKEILLPDDKSISFHSVSSESYSYYNRSDPSVIVSGEFVDVVMTRRGDSVLLNDTSLFPHAEEIAKQAREFAYGHLSKCLSEASPGNWSDYFFGHIRLWTPKGMKDLTSYIIDLNDRERMSREDIASHISDLMGAAEPKIPMNPMSWILEDRPVEVSELKEPKELAIGGTIDASKLTANSISVGAPNHSLNATNQSFKDMAMSAKKTSKQLKSLKSLGVEVYVSNKQESFSTVITVKKGGSSLSKEITNEAISYPGVIDEIIEVMVKEILDKESNSGLLGSSIQYSIKHDAASKPYASADWEVIGHVQPGDLKITYADDSGGKAKADAVAKIYEQASHPIEMIGLSKDDSGETYVTYTVPDDAYKEVTKGNLMGASIVEGPVPGGHFIDYINDMKTYHLYYNNPVSYDPTKGLGNAT